jgi:hypothetical protein
MVSLLNSGTLSIKYRVSEATLNEVKYEEKKRLSNLSFSIRNIQHPKKYGRWNANFKITPSLHYDDTEYQTGKTEFNAATGTHDLLPNINIKRGISMANAKLTAHTPLGAFALSGGFGGTIYRMTDRAGLDTVKTREIRRIDLVWSAFLTKRIFVLAGPRYYKAGYESYVFAFRLGYFWGKI